MASARPHKRSLRNLKRSLHRKISGPQNFVPGPGTNFSGPLFFVPGPGTIFSTVQLANLRGAYFSCRAVGPAPRRLACPAQPRLLAIPPQCVQASTLSYRHLTLSFMHLTLFFRHLTLSYTILHYLTLLTTYDTARSVRV